MCIIQILGCIFLWFCRWLAIISISSFNRLVLIRFSSCLFFDKTRMFLFGRTSYFNCQCRGWARQSPPVRAGTQVRLQSGLCGICGGQSGIRTGLSPVRQCTPLSTSTNVWYPSSSLQEWTAARCGHLPHSVVFRIWGEFGGSRL